jgi:hypothetical protein
VIEFATSDKTNSQKNAKLPFDKGSEWMIGKYKRFDMMRKPTSQWTILRPITWILSFPAVWIHKVKVTKHGMEGVNGPYLLIANHNAFLDFQVMVTAIFPRKAGYIVAIDGFIGWEWLLRAVGCICTRKFTNDVSLVRNMIYAMQKQQNIVVLFPEARYSLCGTSSSLPSSLGKLIKLSKMPVVTLLMNGNHINTPFWNNKDHLVKNLEGTLSLLLTTQQIEESSIEEINSRLNENLRYDDFAWQKKNQIHVKYHRRAEGLHKVLYQCPNCLTEYEMSSYKEILHCNHCGKSWKMTTLGELEALDGPTEFSHIPNWYEWERDNVRQEVRSGTYSFSSDVRIDSLPNAKSFIDLGQGTLMHNNDGFVLTGTCQGEAFEEHWHPRTLYACHIEYEYKKRGDCIDLNTGNDTLYIFPLSPHSSVTKISLATEEIFKWLIAPLPENNRTMTPL